MNSYELSRNWFDWCFENPEKISPNHSALYFFAIEHCNRLGWRKKFGFPTEMAKDAIGIKSYSTYSKTLNDLVEWGFIEMIEKSKNQYSANIIALSNFDKALDKALDKAMIKHMSKQGESTQESIDSIDKPITNKPINQLNQLNQLTIEDTSIEVVDFANQPKTEKIDFEKLRLFFNANCGNMPEVKTMSEKRKKQIRVLEKQYGKELIQTVFEKARDSDFMQGKNANGWTATFDWIIDPKNFLKVAEDNYLNKNNANGTKKQSGAANKSAEEIFRDTAERYKHLIKS